MHKPQCRPDKAAASGKTQERSTTSATGIQHTGSSTFGGADLTSGRLLISRLRVNNPSRKATVGSVAPSHLAPGFTRWRREGWHRLRNPFDHLGIRPSLPLRQLLFDELD